ncbi:MAG: hypothetical protein LBH32_14055, partial [Dysgonamonadaceae bacterium]|nr:hypothetical protein [Dysgonamonadaceae bacterium]
MKLLCFSKKSNLFRLLCVIFACFSITSQAQVTIGANDDPEKGVYLDLNPKGVVHGGLLLPNVYITNMDSIPVNFIGSFTPAERDNYPNLKGMVVYNTNTSLAGGSGEGVYVWDGYKWSVNDGKSSIFTSTCSPASNVAFQGGSISCTVTDPDCTTGGVYSFNLISGSEYAQLRIDNAGTGSFTITFDANNRASERSVVLMVTSPCGRGQVFFYTQDGDINGCNASASAPKIMADKNPVTLCSGGAVYLYLNGNPSGNYIWTLNGNEIGTGTKLVAVSAGKYIVYANKVGCTFFKPDTMNITASSSVAPEKIPVIIAENNGLVCTQTSTVKLTAIATIPSGSQIVWYKDGVRTTTTGLNYNNAGLGEYFAVVEDGNCMSKPSNPVVVQVDPNANAGTINVPNFTINGTPDGSMSSICSGSMLNLKVSSPQPSV